MVYVDFHSRMKQEHLRKLERIAELDGVKISEIIREAIHEYILRKDK